MNENFKLQRIFIWNQDCHICCHKKYIGPILSKKWEKWWKFSEKHKNMENDVELKFFKPSVVLRNLCLYFWGNFYFSISWVKVSEICQFLKNTVFSSDIMLVNTNCDSSAAFHGEITEIFSPSWVGQLFPAGNRD